ncbi:MAG: hypothetical protein ACOYM2_17440 [Rectinemataceae bacterium]
MKQAGIVLAALALLALVLANPLAAQTEAVPATDPAASADTAQQAETTVPAPALPIPLPEAPAAVADPPAAQVEAPSVAAQIAALTRRIALLETDLGAAERKAAGLERGLAAEKDISSAGERAAASLQSELATVSSTAEELRAKLKERDIIADRLALLAAERDRLVVSLGAERSGILDPAGWPVTVLSGFTTAKPKLGTWKLGSAQAEQTNSKEFFSRLEFPLVQKHKSYLYRFSMKSIGKGWVGLGLHFFASDVKSRKGYGEGRSLLVWFTRDPAMRKSDATWLQLYRSDNDVMMEKVVDAKIQEAIGSRLDVGISYDPESGYMTVAVNGKIALRYRAWFGIDEGVGVALRTLGAGGSFGDFEVRTSAR